MFTRRFGLLGWLLLGFSVAACVMGQQQVHALTQIHAHRGAEQIHTQIQPVDTDSLDGRARLKAFDDYLLVHENIPNVVQDLFSLARDEQLSIAHGEYRPQIDVQGRFLRYQMTLPVKGDAQAIYRFIQAALLAQKTLALESVQFKRERIESPNIEARIQWVVLTRLPSGNVADGAVHEL